MYCDYFIWFVCCTVVVLTCFVTCGCVYVGVFGKCVGVLVIRVLVFTELVLFVLFFVLFLLCIFILICFVLV
jgi:hypothetical protein